MYGESTPQRKKQYPDRLVVIYIYISESVSAAEKNESKKKLVAWIYDMMLWGDAYIKHSISFESINNSTSYKILMELWIIYYAYVVTIRGNTTKKTFGKNYCSHTVWCSYLHACSPQRWKARNYNYNDVIMGAMAYQITSLTINNSTVYTGADQRKHQNSASLAFVWIFKTKFVVIYITVFKRYISIQHNIYVSVWINLQSGGFRICV